MTAQYGQGDAPREGVVLPSGGDRPTGEDRNRMADQAPAAGAPWGTPWGPESSPAPGQGPNSGSGYGYPAHDDRTGGAGYGYPQSAPPQPGYGYPQSALQPGYGYPPVDGSSGYGYPGPGASAPGAAPPPSPPAGLQPVPPTASVPLPPAGPPAAAPAGPPAAAPMPPPVPPTAPPAPPAVPPTAAQPLPPSAQSGPPQGAPELHAPPAAYQQPAQLPGPLPESTPAHAPEPYASGPYAPEPYSPDLYADRSFGGLPSGAWQPAAPGGDADSTQFLPPQSDGGAHGSQQPSEGMDATQYIPAQQAQEMDATQFIPPQSGEALDATQVIPPYADGPSGPQQSGAAPHGPQGYEPSRDPQPRSAQHAPDQPVPEAPGRAPYGIRPGAPGDRQPPAEFEMLFRPDNGDRPTGRAGRLPDSGTQPLPVFENAVASQSASAAPRKDTLGAPEPAPRSRRAGASGGQGGGHGTSGGHGGGSGGGRSRPLLIGAGGLALLVGAGLLGGAALGGGDDDGKDDKSSSSQVDEKKDPEPSPEPSEEKPDPAEVQAKELDKLLADSNNSRDAVIRSVENIKKCEKLPEAASDLKDAAAQRNSLVVRLDKLTLDKVPQYQALTEQLRKAWRASESADKHYASWANQVQRPKYCKDGKARPTPHLARGNRESGTATKAKAEAAKLWNPTARTYKLPERQPTQL